METPQIPEFKAPEPRRLQAIAIKAAGMLLRQSTPEDTLVSLVTDVGGYEAHEDTAGRVLYTAEVQPVLTRTLSDETSKSRLEPRFADGADYQDNSGSDLGTAVTRTVNRKREEGPKAQTVRGRAARSLTGYAVKGVGTQPYTNR